ncbi:glycosyltransferase [Pseudofulvibacter geojedonensis]|uniref:Glycosyltransferase n=1 Tax=Pseudofulvibacter geojedonensis TaxID=1123758 RepID=A0ABW3I382_9FLAO
MKKILIISYYWPPAGGPGVQRWLKFVKYLPDFGIEPIVYVPENPSYPLVDENLLDEISDELTILKQPIFEPYKLASIFSKKKTKTISSGLINVQQQSFVEKLLLYVRGNFFIPDARKYWVKPSVNYLSTYISENHIDTIITTGPPHSLHLIGLQLQEKLKVHWLADFRDPWTTIGYHNKLKLTKKSQAKHKTLEKQVLQKANQILVTSPTTKKEFEEITSRPIEVITNGYDDVNFSRNTSLDQKFTISHIGSLLTGRNPEVLWKALSELIKDDVAFSKAFQLQLIGAVSRDVLDSIQSFGLERHINLVGYVSHQEAQIAQRQSQILLLIEIDSPETKCIIPGKVYEYIQSGRPILAFGPEQADFKQIITQTNTGKSFNYTDDITVLKEQIVNYFKAYQESKLTVHGLGIQQYHRKELTRRLASLLKK